jgi:hypothetical protein
MILVDKIILLFVSDLSIMHFFILQYKNAVKIKKNQSELQIKVNQIDCIWLEFMDWSPCWVNQTP